MDGSFYVRYKVEPPGLIKLENEIEMEEKAPEPPSSPVSPTQGTSFKKCSSCKKSTGQLLDDAVSMTYSSSYYTGIYSMETLIIIYYTWIVCLLYKLPKYFRSIIEIDVCSGKAHFWGPSL